MTPNHYVKNGSFTKHPFESRCFGYQVLGFSMDLFASNSVFWTTKTEESCCLLGKEKLECVRGRRSTKNRKNKKAKKHFTKKHGNKCKKVTHTEPNNMHQYVIRYPPPETSPSFGFNSTNLHEMNVLFFFRQFKKSYDTVPYFKGARYVREKKYSIVFEFESFLTIEGSHCFYKPLEVRFVGGWVCWQATCCGTGRKTSCCNRRRGCRSWWNLYMYTKHAEQKMLPHNDFGGSFSQLSISYFYDNSMIWFGYSKLCFQRDTWDESKASPWPQSHHLQWLCAWTFTGDANPLFVKGEQTLAEKILGMPQARVFLVHICRISTNRACGKWHQDGLVPEEEDGVSFFFRFFGRECGIHLPKIHIEPPKNHQKWGGLHQMFFLFRIEHLRVF